MAPYSVWRARRAGPGARPGRGQERLDPVRRGCVRAEFGGQRAGRLREGVEVQGELRRGLGGRQAPAFGAVETGHLRHRVGAAAGYTDLPREGTHRVSPTGHVNPRATQIDRRARQVDRVQPATDPVAGLQHDTLNSAVRQRVRYRQPGDPGAHHQHALGLPGQPSGDVRPPIIEAPSGQPGHPLVGERPRYQRDVQRHPAD
jgi:hypothetical protein